MKGSTDRAPDNSGSRTWWGFVLLALVALAASAIALRDSSESGGLATQVTMWAFLAVLFAADAAWLVKSQIRYH